MFFVSHIATPFLNDICSHIPTMFLDRYSFEEIEKSCALFLAFYRNALLSGAPIILLSCCAAPSVDITLSSSSRPDVTRT